jgi:MOSC domain-containing protein YiiM
MGEALGRIVSVNVGLPQTTEWHGRQVSSAIWRQPIDGPVEIVGHRLVGDESADLRVHGGLDKALYAYSTEDYAWWAGEMPDTTFHPGLFGENLTTEGIDLGDAVIGDRWQIGTAVLEVSQPRFPCANLGMRMGDAAFKDRFDQARRNGAYFRVVETGRLETGDEVVRVAAPPDHGIRIADVVDSKHGAPAELLERILALDIATDAMLTLARRGLARLERS